MCITRRRRELKFHKSLPRATTTSWRALRFCFSGVKEKQKSLASFYRETILFVNHQQKRVAPYPQNVVATVRTLLIILFISVQRHYLDGDIHFWKPSQVNKSLFRPMFSCRTDTMHTRPCKYDILTLGKLHFSLMTHRFYTHGKSTAIILLLMRTSRDQYY